jgi:RNA polymerase sigma-70 factor (ECF subfamily)
LARVDLERAFAKLSPPESAALTMCFALGLSNSEAAAAMDIPLGTLKSHVLRGREKLKAILGDP